ncbi:MAG: LAGLIDADG family homing endonuclease [Candidatus Omnitrophota bacterium]
MLDPWYVTGFCDGEAAFTYSRAGGSLAIYFGVKQREDNRQIVDDIRAFFDYVGKIYYQIESEGGPKRGLSQPAVYYRVTKINELKRIIEHFDKYPLQSVKKQQAYLVWRQMVIYKSEHYRDVDYNILQNLAEKLSKLNSKSRAFKVHKK